jgi:hypothetical protein
VRFPRFYARVFLALLAVALWEPGARAADVTIKIGYIDPFSGAFAAGGDASLKMFQFIIDNINAKGGALGKKFELVTFDDKRPCCMDQPVDAVIPCPRGLMRCGRSSGVPAPAYGSGRRQQLPLRPLDARWFASAVHDR